MRALHINELKPFVGIGHSRRFSADPLMFGPRRAAGKNGNGRKDHRAVGLNSPTKIEYRQGPLPLRGFPI